MGTAVSFVEGESQKTIYVPILDDPTINTGLTPPDLGKYLEVDLSNPAGDPISNGPPQHHRHRFQHCL